MVIFDSNIWIGYFYNEDPHHRLSQGLFSKQKLEEIIVTEYIVLKWLLSWNKEKDFLLQILFLSLSKNLIFLFYRQENFIPVQKTCFNR